uniref:Uncharacterized protein n=1 Tax=Clastoptera arizonana TaxID=38151 RepID=A0A1B6DHG0_9HEMI
MDIPLPDDPPPKKITNLPVNIQLPPSIKPQLYLEEQENVSQSENNYDQISVGMLPTNFGNISNTKANISIENKFKNKTSSLVYSPSNSEPSPPGNEMSSPLNSASNDFSNHPTLEIELPASSPNQEYDTSPCKFTPMDVYRYSASPLNMDYSSIIYPPGMEGQSNSSSKFPWDVEPPIPKDPPPLPSDPEPPQRDSLSPWEINLPLENEKQILQSTDNITLNVETTVLKSLDMDIPMPDDSNRYSPSLPVDDEPPLEMVPPQSKEFSGLETPPLPPSSFTSTNTVLGKMKAKKRLMAFSMTKQVGGSGLSFALNKKTAALSKDTAKAFDEKGDEGKKKNLKKGQTINKAKDTISEIEELKRKEMMLRENMQLLHPRWNSKDSNYFVDTKKTEEIESIVGEILAKKDKKRDDKRSGSEEKDRHRSSKSKKSNRDRDHERRKRKPKTLPLNWNEFKKDGHKVHHFRRFKFEVSKLEAKEKRSHRRRSRSRDRRSRSRDREKKESKKSNTQPPGGRINLFDTPMEIRKVLVALTVRGDEDVEFPEFLVKHTKCKPQLSFCENPRFATYHFMNRKELLASVPLEIEEIIAKFLSSIRQKRLKVKSDIKGLVDNTEAGNRNDLDSSNIEIEGRNENIKEKIVKLTQDGDKAANSNIDKDIIESNESNNEAKSFCTKLHRNWYNHWKTNQFIPQFFDINIDEEIEIEEIIEPLSLNFTSLNEEISIDADHSNEFTSRQRNISKSSDNAVVTEELEPIIRTAIRSKWDSDYEDSEETDDVKKDVKETTGENSNESITNGVVEDVTNFLKEVDEDNLGVVPMEIEEKPDDIEDNIEETYVEEQDKKVETNVVEKLASEYEEFMKMVSFENPMEKNNVREEEKATSEQENLESSKSSEDLNKNVESSNDKVYSEFLAEHRETEDWETHGTFYNRFRSESPGDSVSSDKEKKVSKKKIKKIIGSKIKKKLKDKVKKKKKKYSSSESSSSSSSNSSSDDSSSSESSSSSDSSSTTSSSSSDSSVDEKKLKRKKQIEKLKKKSKKKLKKNQNSSSSEDDEEEEDKPKKDKKKKKKFDKKKKYKSDKEKSKDKKSKKKQKDSSDDDGTKSKKVKKSKKSKNKENLEDVLKSKSSKDKKQKKIDNKETLTKSLKRLSHGDVDSDAPKKRIRSENLDSEIPLLNIPIAQNRNDSLGLKDFDEDFKKSKEFQRLKKRESNFKDSLSKGLKPLKDFQEFLMTKHFDQIDTDKKEKIKGEIETTVPINKEKECKTDTNHKNEHQDEIKGVKIKKSDKNWSERTESEDDSNPKTSKNKKKSKKEKKSSKLKKKKHKKKLDRSSNEDSSDDEKDVHNFIDSHINFLRDENFLLELGKHRLNKERASPIIKDDIEKSTLEEKTINNSKENINDEFDEEVVPDPLRRLDWQDDSETRGSLLKNLSILEDSGLKDRFNDLGFINDCDENYVKSDSTYKNINSTTLKSICDKYVKASLYSDHSKNAIFVSPTDQLPLKFLPKLRLEHTSDEDSIAKRNKLKSPSDSSLGDVEIDSQDDSFVLEKDFLTEKKDIQPSSFQRGVFSVVSLKENDSKKSDSFEINKTINTSSNVLDSDRYSPTLDLDVLSPSSLPKEKLGSDMSLDSENSVHKSNLHMLDIPLPPPVAPSVEIPLLTFPTICPAPVPPPLISSTSFKNILSIPTITAASPQIETIPLKINLTRKNPIRLPLSNTRLTLNKPLGKVKPANIFGDEDDSSNDSDKNAAEPQEKLLTNTAAFKLNEDSDDCKKKRSRWGMEPEDEPLIVKDYLSNKTESETVARVEHSNESQSTKDISNETSFEKEKMTNLEKDFSKKTDEQILNEKRELQPMDVSNIHLENALEAWKDQEDFNNARNDHSNDKSVETNNKITEIETPECNDKIIGNSYNETCGNEMLNQIIKRDNFEDDQKSDSTPRKNEHQSKRDYSDDRSRSSRRRDSSRDWRHKVESSRDRRDYSRRERSRSKERRKEYYRRESTDRKDRRRNRSRERRGRREISRDRKREKREDRESPRRRDMWESPKRRDFRDSPTRKEDFRESVHKKDNVKSSSKHGEDYNIEKFRSETSAENLEIKESFDERKPLAATESGNESINEDNVNMEHFISNIKQEPTDDGYEKVSGNAVEVDNSLKMETVQKPAERIQKIKINLINPPTKSSDVTRKLSPLGLKKSVADSTISDSELNTTPVKRILRTSVCLSPKRLSLDDRIELELGVRKSPPLAPPSQHQTFYQIPVHDGSQMIPQVVPVPSRRVTALVQPPRVNWNNDVFTNIGTTPPAPPTKTQVLQKSFFDGHERHNQLNTKKITFVH